MSHFLTGSCSPSSDSRDFFFRTSSSSSTNLNLNISFPPLKATDCTALHCTSHRVHQPFAFNSPVVSTSFHLSFQLYFPSSISAFRVLLDCLITPLQSDPSGCPLDRYQDFVHSLPSISDQFDKMAAPPTKRIKTDPDPKKPIIFTSPGTQPDTRLRVFDQDFLVYSGLLRINSAFFRKFLEPSGGKPPASSEAYQYEWFTKIDGDGKTWSLTSDSKVTGSAHISGSLANIDPGQFRNAEISRFTGGINAHQEAIRNLLCAIFNRPYEIGHVVHLQRMTAHAEYYCCLPIVSHSLWGPLVNSPKFVPSIEQSPCHTLVAAYKLRHKQLFKDAFILCLGPWKRPRYEQLRELNEPKLFQMAEAAHTTMCTKLLNVQQGIIQIFADANNCFKDTGKIMVDLADQAFDDKHSVLLPRYYRLCYEYNYKSKEGAAAVKKLLGPILKKNLVLDKSTSSSGQGSFRDYFLSYQVDTYPWDDSQLDW